MGRHRERGHAAVWVVGALGVSIAVGVSVFLVIKDHRGVVAEARSTPVELPPEPHRPALEPPIAPAPAPEPTPPADEAEAGAVDPELDTMFGTPGIDGKLDPDEVKRIITRTQAKLTTCFAEPARAGGIVRVMMMINRRGGVTTIAASGIDDALDRCVESALRDVRFGKTADGNPAKIVVPIAFHDTDRSDLAPAPPTRTAGGDGACDEVACVLENYESPCCAKYKAAPPAQSVPRTPPRDEIARAFRSMTPRIQACASAAGLTGVLRLRLQILPDGSVAAASVTDVDAVVATCVLRAAHRLKLTTSQNGVTATFPYTVQ